MELFKDENLRGNLTEFFEDNIVVLGDISVGASDLGQTPLEADVPMIIIHAALLNGLLTNTFFDKWSLPQVQGLVVLMGLLLGAAASLRQGWML